jgi:succinate-acetate transporter protein
VVEFNKKVRVMVGLVGCFLLCMNGLYHLTTGSLWFVPIILAIGGFIGCIEGIIEWRKMDVF